MTYKEFRSKWILDPSKEMIIEKEIIEAYRKHIQNKYTFEDVWNAEKPICGKCEMLGDIAPCDECYLKGN